MDDYNEEAFNRVIDIEDEAEPIPLNIHWKYNGHRVVNNEQENSEKSDEEDQQGKFIKKIVVGDDSPTAQYKMPKNLKKIYTAVERNVLSFISVKKQRVVRMYTKNKEYSDLVQQQNKETQKVMDDSKFLLGALQQQSVKEQKGVFIIPSKNQTKNKRNSLLNGIQEGIKTLRNAGLQSILKTEPNQNASNYSKKNSSFNGGLNGSYLQTEQSEENFYNQNLNQNQNLKTEPSVKNYYEFQQFRMIDSKQSRKETPCFNYQGSNQQQKRKLYSNHNKSFSLHQQDNQYQSNQNQNLDPNQQQTQKPNSPFPFLMQNKTSLNNKLNRYNNKGAKSLINQNNQEIIHEESVKQLPVKTDSSFKGYNGLLKDQSTGVVNSQDQEINQNQKKINSNTILDRMSLCRRSYIDETALYELENQIYQQKIQEQESRRLSQQANTCSNNQFYDESIQEGQQKLKLKELIEKQQQDMKIFVLNRQRKKNIDEIIQNKGKVEIEKLKNLQQQEVWENSTFYKNIQQNKSVQRKQELTSKQNNALYSIMMLPKKSYMKIKEKLNQNLPEESRFNNVF